jgi:hypothetical protein
MEKDGKRNSDWNDPHYFFSFSGIRSKGTEMNKPKIIHLKRNGKYIKPYPNLTWVTNYLFSKCYSQNINSIIEEIVSPGSLLLVCIPKSSVYFSLDRLTGAGIVGLYKLNQYDGGKINFLVL